MAQNHLRWSPDSCGCILDILVDDVTGNQTLFAIRNICPDHIDTATDDPAFDTKKAQLITDRYKQLDDNLNANLAAIDAYTDLQCSPADKAMLRSQVQAITAARKAEYDILASEATNLNARKIFCTNTHSNVNEESGRWPKIYARVQSQFALTDQQMATVGWKCTGKAPNRVFTINFGNLLTNQQKTQIQTWANTNIGAGKVVVQ